MNVRDLGRAKLYYSWSQERYRTQTGLGPTILSWNYILIGWLQVSFLLNSTTCLSLSLLNRAFHEGLVSSVWPWKCAQLVLTLGPIIHIVKLHFVILVRGLIFLCETCCFSWPFWYLLLKCLLYQKCSHLCHCFSYSISGNINHCAIILFHSRHQERTNLQKWSTNPTTPCLHPMLGLAAASPLRRCWC
jgi:hypothetical protein